MALLCGRLLVTGSGRGSNEATRSRWFGIGTDDGNDASRHSAAGFLDRLMGRDAGSYASVTVRVTHSLTDGEITVWSGNRRVLSEDLEADEKEFKPFGTTVFSYHRATNSGRSECRWKPRSAGSRAEQGRTRSGRDVSGSLAPDGRYVLDIDVGTWPLGMGSTGPRTEEPE
jgi:hypothetical protein